MKILITRPLPGDAADMVRSAMAPAATGLEIDANREDRRLEPDELLDRCRGCTAILTTPRDRVDAAVLDAAGPTLRIVSNYAVGVDNIDLAACRERGVLVGHTPDAVTEPTADMAWLLILAAGRRAFEGDALIRSGEWRGVSPKELNGHRLVDKNLLIVGAGRIGLAVARRALGWRMRVRYVARTRHPEFEAAPLDAERVELDRGLAEADVVSLHTPLTPETRHLLDRRRLALMKPTSILVNTARGAVIDEAALVEALRAGRPGSAGLDVFENEPRIVEGLAALRNVFLMPHLGSSTHEDRVWMTRQAVDNLVAALRGEPVPREASGGALATAAPATPAGSARP